MVKTVSFKSSEKELIDFIQSKYFSSYIKELIKKDMQNNEPIKKEVPKEETRKPRRNADFEF